MIRRQNTRHGPNDRTNRLVHSLLFWTGDDFRKGGAIVCVGEVLGAVKDARVFGEVVVVVGRGFGDGAGLTWFGKVEIGVFGGEDGVGGANDGADFGGGHRRRRLFRK